MTSRKPAAPPLNAQKYKTIYVPAMDVYTTGGPSVFSNLCAENGECNLVVLPIGFVRELGDTKNLAYGMGGEDVLAFLKERDSTALTKDIKLYSPYEGLDIAVVSGQKVPGQDAVKILGNLEQVISSTWKPSNGDHPVLVTNSPVLTVEFQGNNMKVEPPAFLIVNSNIVEQGILDGNERLFAHLTEHGGSAGIEAACDMLHKELYLNQFVRFQGNKPGHFRYARVTGDIEYKPNSSRIAGVNNVQLKLLDEREYGRKIRVGTQYRDDVLGISPLDMEQYLALQYGLLNPDVSLFFLTGGQGSGKTLLGYVSAVDQILTYSDKVLAQRGVQRDESGGFMFGFGSFFKQIVLLKPNDIIGGQRREVGFLPGTLYDKLRPHLQAYEDAHKESELAYFSFDEMLRHPAYDNEFGPQRNAMLSRPGVQKRGGKHDRSGDCSYDGYYLPDGIEAVQMTYSGYMRGRSFRNVLVLIDEAQNFTPYEVKTILSRLGEGCKCVIMGDPAQRDNPFCTREINGLTHAIRHYLHKPYSALVSLSKNYRSEISDDANTWHVYG